MARELLNNGREVGPAEVVASCDVWAVLLFCVIAILSELLAVIVRTRTVVIAVVVEVSK
jgi:hypothetical protein